MPQIWHKKPIYARSCHRVWHGCIPCGSKCARFFMSFMPQMPHPPLYPHKNMNIVMIKNTSPYGINGIKIKINNNNIYILLFLLYFLLYLRAFQVWHKSGISVA